MHTPTRLTVTFALVGVLVGCNPDPTTTPADDGAPAGDAAPASDRTEPVDALAEDDDARTPPDPEPSRPLRAALAALGATPCPDLPGFFCGALTVALDPLDPEAAAPGAPTVSIGFAARPADETPSLGLLFELSGGPGYSGLAEADDWTWLDPGIAEGFDMVFFDLRGVGVSGGFDCPQASAEWEGRGLRGATPAEREGLAARAERFALDCTTEIGTETAVQARHDTLRAAFDLEALRRGLGGGPVTLSGVSYGTQLAQTYVTLYPEHVRAVVLDGAIDLTRRGLTYALDLTASVEQVRVDTLTACADAPACAADFAPETPAGAFERVATRLRAASLPLDFPLPDATVRPRTLDAVDFDAVSFAALADEALRTRWLRALAAAHRGRLVPLRRLADALSGTDAFDDVIAPIPFDETGFSDAVYYTITCHDYGRPEEGVAGWLSACAAAGETARLTSPCFGDLPCATWPTAPPERPRPATFAPAGIPVLVINATGDTATPVSQGRAVVAGLRAAGATVREVSVTGGHHVMWGSDACVDASVSAFLFEPDTPRRDVECDVGVLGAYPPLMSAKAETYDTASAFVRALFDELDAHPEFPYPVAWGCDGGGIAEIDGFGGLTFDACRFVPGLDLLVDGEGRYDWDTDALTLELHVTGAHTGDVVCSRDADLEVDLSGTWDGAAVTE
jgi:pimeloyl-ACP methyl ester carboxylesterase